MRLPSIAASWPVAKRVHALVTTRQGGASTGRYSSLNLGAHVGDDAQAVAENRRRLVADLGLPAEPGWLRQVHGTAVAEAGAAMEVTADAAITSEPGRVCVVMVADCLPVFLADRDGTRIGVAHAGWRGLVAGVLESTLAAMQLPPERLVAWLGPAIGPAAFEVGPEVRAEFVARQPESVADFAPGDDDRWLADLGALARRRLAEAGVTEVHGGGICTWSDPERFFSYRRDGHTGRMAALIWIG